MITEQTERSGPSNVRRHKPSWCPLNQGRESFRKDRDAHLTQARAKKKSRRWN